MQFCSLWTDVLMKRQCYSLDPYCLVFIPNGQCYSWGGGHYCSLRAFKKKQPVDSGLDWLVANYTGGVSNPKHDHTLINGRHLAAVRPELSPVQIQLTAPQWRHGRFAKNSNLQVQLGKVLLKIVTWHPRRAPFVASYWPMTVNISIWQLGKKRNHIENSWKSATESS
jgi:hypothetical protein